MEPLFLAVICGCHAGLYREALHEVYRPRIQRGNSSFAANVLGARGALLSVLVHFFEQGRWDSPLKTGGEGQHLTAEDQLFILMQAALYLTATRGMGAPEVRICYERAEALCHSHRRPLLLYVALMGQWRYSFATDKLTATLQIAQRIYSLAEEQKDSSLMMGACQALTSTLYFSGEFETARRYAMSCVQIWRSEDLRSPVEEVIAPVVVCLCYEALVAVAFRRNGVLPGDHGDSDPIGDCDLRAMCSPFGVFPHGKPRCLWRNFYPPIDSHLAGQNSQDASGFALCDRSRWPK